MKKEETKKCKECGKEFKLSRFLPKQMFCSNECRYIDVKKKRKKNGWKPKKCKCIVCNKIFTQKTSNHTKCCSSKCSKVFQSFEWRVLNLHLIDNFDGWCKLRFEIFKRDNFTCQYCGRNFKEDGIKLHCDHIIPKNSGGKDVPENLTTACEECNLGKLDVLLDKKLLEIH